MTNIKVDTQELRESGDSIIGLSLELRETFNVLYSKINNFTSNSWKGVSANEFAQRTSVEKVQYINLANQIASLGKTINAIAEQYEVSIKRQSRG